MSGLHEVDCSGCGRRHVTSGEQARKLRVLRCECGHFVRLDRALAERRSEPAPALDAAGASHEESEDDATRLLAAAAVSNGRARTRSARPSIVDDERVSRPVQRASAPRSLSPGPTRMPSIAPSEKPLWYVDLGGTDLVEMTIEQLILARRSGKLGEGALVWREGMPSWRPVGTLIPAASASSHPSPGPGPSAPPGPSRPALTAAIRTPLPARPSAPLHRPAANPLPEEATPQSLASYERPLATLEFAFEKPEPQPLRAATRSPLPGIEPSAAQHPRPPTPLPRASLSAAFNSPFPRSAPLPQLAAATAMPSDRSSPLPPAPPPPPAAYASPVPAAPTSHEGDRPSQHAFTSLLALDPVSGRPRWVSAGIALVVCITASAAGASLVRSLKQRQKPQATPASAVIAPVVTTTSASRPSELPASTSSSAPRVVDLESLSVEHRRTLPRAPRVAPKLAPAESDSSEESAPPATEPAEQSPPDAPKSTDLPAAARSNPYGSGSLIDQIKKATADEEAGQ